MRLAICHLYPDLMNLYGDRGNVITLTRRSEWRGIRADVSAVGLGEDVDFTAYDILFMGGGQDKEQKLICEDFQGLKGRALTQAVEDGIAFLAICGAYQLLGRYYETGCGERLPGIGLLDVETRAGKKRMIGNVVIASELGGGRPRTLVGFENHSGRTYLGARVRPLGRVCLGYGNNGEDGFEGAVYRNVVGTYLHGSVLPKNPWLADWLIARALERRYGPTSLAPLDDGLERAAHDAAIIHAGRLARLYRTPVRSRDIAGTGRRRQPVRATAGDDPEHKANAAVAVVWRATVAGQTMGKEDGK
ncbi:MAG: glutamine amidotransferase [Bacillota bacterium]|nr:MAG: glutamine amidotransferase [Bacillota bacterium]